MSAPLTLDRSYFQTLLASAFVVQESRLDPQSLSAFLEVQRAIRSDGLNRQKAMELIAERARLVSRADGVAIALAEDDQFIYRAASGIATSCIGSKIRVMLFFSAHREAATRILKIENSHGDPRAETVICRQFESQALLLVPVYKGEKLAGFLQLLYRNPHSFLDREISVCRLIVSLTEEALARAQTAAKTSPKVEATQSAAIPQPAKPGISAAVMIANTLVEEDGAQQEEVREEDSVARKAARIKAVLQSKAPQPVDSPAPLAAKVETPEPVVSSSIANPQPVEVKVQAAEPVAIASPVKETERREEEIPGEVVVAPTPVVAGPSWIDRARGTIAATAAHLLVLGREITVRIKIRKRRRSVLPGMLRRAVPAGLVLGMLGGVSWLDWQMSSIAYGSSPLPAVPAEQTFKGAQVFSNAPQRTPGPPASLAPSVANDPGKPLAHGKITAHHLRTATANNVPTVPVGLKKVRVGANEVDYVSDDVTMRVFKGGDTPEKREPGRQGPGGASVIRHSSSDGGRIPTALAPQTDALTPGK